MTTDIESKLAAIEAELRVRGVTGFDSSTWLIAEVRRLTEDNVKSRNRVKEQTAATQEAHEFVDNEIRSHLEGFVELGDKSCPIWQRVRSAVARLTDEVHRLTEACEKGKAIIHDIADGSEYRRGREDAAKIIRDRADEFDLCYHDGDIAKKLELLADAIERGEYVEGRK